MATTSSNASNTETTMTSTTKSLKTQGCDSCGHGIVVAINWHGQFCSGCADALDPTSDDFDHGY